MDQPVGVCVAEEVTDSTAPSCCCLFKSWCFFSSEESHRSTNSVIYKFYTACCVQLYMASPLEINLLEEDGSDFASCVLCDPDCTCAVVSRKQENILLLSK